MVKWLWLIFMPLWLMALPAVNVETQLDEYQISANRPLTATLMITHPVTAEIDLSSVTLDGKPIELTFVKKVPLGNDQFIQIFKYTLPAYTPGEYEMPILNIKIGDQRYSSLPARFIVPAEGTLSRHESVEKPFLSLEAEVQPSEETIYPGQRLSFIYRYIYRGEVELTKEILPLFNPKGFTKIGEERVNDYVRNGDSIREVILDVQADEPGLYRFEGSEIEGLGYFADNPPETLKAKTKPLNITIAPFPDQKQPVSFDGAQGEFTIQTSLLSPNSLQVGDKLLLAVDIYGSSKALQNITLPKLQCQPGFSGLFTFDPVPVSGIQDEQKMRFVIPIRPTNDLVTEIPSVYFSFYDSKTYKTVHSNPIAIKVLPVQNVLTADPVTQQKNAAQENWEEQLAYLKPLTENDITLLGPKDLRNLGASAWTMLWILPIGIAALAGQFEWKKRLEAKKIQQKETTAADLFRQAMASQGQEDLFYWLLTRSMLLKLFEQKTIDNTDISIDNLPESEVKTFLLRLDRRRYGDGTVLKPAQVADEAREIFKRMDG